MNFVDTVTEMIERYPKLFPTRLHAMDHLFCVIGNGYHWQDGELVEEREITEQEAKWQEERDEEVDKMMRETIALIPNSAWAQEWLMKDAAAKKTKENAAIIAVTKVDSMGADDFYPVSDFSYVCAENIPLNVKPDWAEALSEMREILAKNGITIPAGKRSDLDDNC